MTLSIADLSYVQAMNGTRSAELSGSGVVDSVNSDPDNEQQPSSAVDEPILDASQLAAESATPPAQPGLQQAGEQATEQQAVVGFEEGSSGVHHQSIPSWQQSEGSMQEEASTSASSESGISRALWPVRCSDCAV